jgi:hypothetical protein
MPFPRDDQFVGRESIMTSLDGKFQSKALHNNHLRVALVGIGGIGYVNAAKDSRLH